MIDAHHHLWDPTRVDYPFLTDELAATHRPFTPADLAPLLASAGVERTVVVQTRSSLDETRELMATAAATPFIAGVIGWVDLTDPDVAATLAALQGRPDGQTLVGIRHQVHDEPEPEWLVRPDVGSGLRAVADAGLAYDLLVRPRELPAALAVARAVPDLRLVIDHLAKPPIASGEIAAWAELMRPFGPLAHVSCKLSGMVTEADWAAWTPADLRPYVAEALTIFGEDRLLFGSDWPVCLLAASYGQVLDALEQTLGDLSAAARAKVFGLNAARVYGLS